MIYVFGGYNALEEEHFNDMYCFCPNTNVWCSVRAFGRSPCQRRRQACVIVRNKLYLFGGTRFVLNISNALVLFQIFILCNTLLRI